MPDAQLVQVPLGGGLDETTDDAFVPVTKMRVCQNVVFPDGNTCTKRKGLTQVVSSPGLLKIIARENDLLAINGQSAIAYSPATGNATSSRGTVSPCLVTRLPLTTGGAANDQGASGVNASTAVNTWPPMAECATGNGYLVAVWNNGNAVAASVYDVTNQTFLRTFDALDLSAGDMNATGQLNGQQNQPRVFVLGTTAVAVWYNVAAGAIYYALLSLTTPNSGWSAATLLVSSNAGDLQVFDCSPIGGSTTDFALLIADPTISAGNSEAALFRYSLSGGSFTQIYGVPFYTLNWTGAGYSNYHMWSCSVSASNTDGVILCAFSEEWSQGGTFYHTLQAYSRTTASGSAISNGYIVQDNFTSNTPGATAQCVTPAIVRCVGVERRYGSGSGNSSEFDLVWTRDNRYLVPPTGSSIVVATIPATYAFTFVANSIPTTPTPWYLPCFQMAGKPFAANGGTLVPCMVSDAAQPTQILFQLPSPGVNANTPLVPLATWAPRYSAANGGVTPSATTAIGVQARNGGATNTGNKSATLYSFVGTFESQSTSTAVAVFNFDFANVALWQSVTLGPYAYLAAGMPMVYDGASLTEVGFLHAPAAPGFSALTTGGAIPSGATVQYALCWSQQDGQGNIHRSPPSAVTTFTSPAGSGTGSVYLVFEPLRATLRQAALTGSNLVSQHPVMVEIYRSTSTGSGVLQLIAVVENEPTEAVMVYLDTQSDATVASNPFLYTVGGGVPSVCPPSLSALAVHADRVWGADETGVTTYYTSQLVTGEAPRFSDLFTQNWPEGPITAAWSLEQRLHVATSRRIFSMFGFGPNEEGAGSDFTSPEVWQADLGVADPRGMCLCQPGALIATQKGIYLESRGGDFMWFGERFQRTLATYPAVQSMVALDTDGAVRISLQAANGAAQAGVTVHWDYRHDRLSTHVNAAESYGLVSTCVAGGVFYGLYLASGILVKEDSTTSLDQGAWMTVQLTTGWADVAGKEGSCRVDRAMLLAVSQTPHGMKIETARDYSGTFDSDDGLWSDSDIAAMSIEQMRHSPTQRKCMAMSVRLTDQAPTTLGAGTGQGATYRTLLLRSRSRRGEWKRTNVAQQR